MLARIRDGWLELAHYIGDFQARLILTTLYFTMVVPFTLVARSGDPLGLSDYANRGLTSGWVARRPGDQNLADSGRQF